MILYFSKTRIKDEELFMEEEDMKELLRSLQEEITTRVAEEMEKYSLCDFSIGELLYGINPEEFPESEQEE